MSHRSRSRILNRLRLAAGGLVTHDELLTAVKHADMIRLRHDVWMLREMGFPIINEQRRGYYFRPWQHLWEVEP